MAAAAALHSALSSLSPASAESLLSTPEEFTSIFSSQLLSSCLIANSVPVPIATTHLTRGRARSSASTGSEQDILSAISHSPDSTIAAPDGGLLKVRDLHDQWAPVALGKKDNELGFHVYKLPGKDGHGAWFARRSVHTGVAFDDMKLGLQREMRITRDKEEDGLKVSENKELDSNKGIRGIGCERRLEKRSKKKVGKAEVLYLSARFPGPMAPRDFCTLSLSSSGVNCLGPGASSPTFNPTIKPREFVIISQPVASHACLPASRNNFVRGKLESVELIREVLIPSSGVASVGSQSAMQAVEWIMIGRNDPGGSVPRWMVEKGTPAGIVKDAKMFLEWVCGADGGAVMPGGENIYISDDEDEQANGDDDEDEQAIGGDDDGEDEQAGGDDDEDAASRQSFATAASHDSSSPTLAHSEQPANPSLPAPTNKKLQSLLSSRTTIDQQIDLERSAIAALTSRTPPFLDRDQATLVKHHQKTLSSLLKTSTKLTTKYEKELRRQNKKSAAAAAAAENRCKRARGYGPSIETQPAEAQGQENASLRKEVKRLQAANEGLRDRVQRLEAGKREQLTSKYLWRHTPPPAHCHVQGCDCGNK